MQKNAYPQSCFDMHLLHGRKEAFSIFIYQSEREQSTQLTLCVQGTDENRIVNIYANVSLNI